MSDVEGEPFGGGLVFLQLIVVKWLCVYICIGTHGHSAVSTSAIPVKHKDRIAEPRGGSPR